MEPWPVPNHGLVVYPPGAGIPARTTPGWMLVWALAGDSAALVDGVEQAFVPGTVLMLPPQAVRSWRWDEAGYSRHGYVHFLMSVPPAGLPPAAEWPLARRPDAGDLLLPLLTQLIAALARGDAVGADLCLRLAVRVFVSGHGAGGDGEDAPPPALIAAAFAWLADRWARFGIGQVPLTDLARATGVSGGHLGKVFRRHFALSPMEAQRRIRLERVGHLVRDQGMAVQDAAEAAGFASQFHCTRAFHALFGMPPSALRSGGAAAAALPKLSPPALAREAERLWKRVVPPPPRRAGGRRR